MQVNNRLATYIRTDPNDNLSNTYFYFPNIITDTEDFSVSFWGVGNFKCVLYPDILTSNVNDTFVAGENIYTSLFMHAAENRFLSTTSRAHSSKLQSTNDWVNNINYTVLHHIVVTYEYSTKTVKTYFDNVLIDTIQITIISSTDDWPSQFYMKFAAFIPNQVDFGESDDIFLKVGDPRIYNNKTLSTSEITDLYNLYSGGF